MLTVGADTDYQVCLVFYLRGVLALATASFATHLKYPCFMQRIAFLLLVLGSIAGLARALTFQDWQTASFTTEQLSEAAISGATVDPDGDGIANLHEYVFFGQPLTVETNLMPVLSQAAGHLVLTYRERHALTDVSVRLQGSDTLSNWITYNSVTEADREVFTDYDEVTLIDPQPFTQSKRFLRLRVELLPASEPQAPTQLVLKVVTPTSWSIGWTDPNVTETSYAVEHRLPTNVWERLSTLGADTGDWQHTAANYQTSMTYRVVAIGEGGAEAASEPITLPDADGDGIPNALELGSSYVGSSGTYASKPDQFSSTGTGVSDGWLAVNGFNPATHDTSLDTDGDGFSDAEEAVRGTDPRDTDTDNDGVLDPDDGWPRHAWITVAPLPEVRYAVVRLQSLGWPAGIQAGELDDKGDVLSAPIPNGGNMSYRFWNASTQAIETTPWTFAASAFPYITPIITGGKRLGRNGHVIGNITPNGVKRQAVVWTSGATAPTSLDDTFLDNGSVEFYGSMATAVNGAGKVIGIGAQDIHPVVAEGEYAEYSYGYRRGGLDFRNEQAAWLAGQNLLSISYDAGPIEPSAEGVAYYPNAINESGLITAQRESIPDSSDPYTSVLTSGIIDLNNVFHPLGDGSIYAIMSGEPTVAIGYGNEVAWWAHVVPASGQWQTEPLQVWDANTQMLVAPSASAERINDKLEILSGSHIIRNGVVRPLMDYLPAGWSNVAARDINNHGVILAQTTRTLDDQGQSITNPQPEPILLLPVELTSEDRLVKGAITIPEGWSNVALSFRSTAQGGLDFGTFSGLEPGVTESTTYIYASQDDILSETELSESQSDTLDPRANTQAVVFYRDTENPRRLHFVTAFDQVGEIEIALSFGSGAAPTIAKVKHTLTAQSETAGLIGTIDQRIQSISIPEIIDFDLDTDGDGLPDGGSADLITASQPGTMTAPGAFVSEAAEDDPLNLVLLVNSDDDNTDTFADSLHTDLAVTDDDLARIVLRAPSSLSSPVGTLTLTHNGGPSLRLRFATGPPVASGTSVNLASPSGILAGLATGAVTLYAEGLAPASDVAITLTYTPVTGDPVADTVHLTVLDPASLASLQTRHRYFALRGDLGGLASRTYTANGAYHQRRLGLAPIGENLPIQNRTLLAKALLPVIGAIKTRAAFYRGAADGFWFGLKSDRKSVNDAGTAIGSAIAFVYLEDEGAKLARAIILYHQLKELKKVFTAQRALVLAVNVASGQMAITITRDLYSDAEAALGWDPVTPVVDVQVLSYMHGIATGFVTEQLVVGTATGAILTRIGPVIRGVVTAFENGTRYSLEVLSDASKASAKLLVALGRVAKTEEEVKAVAHAVQKARFIELPGGLKVPQVIDNWFKTKPQLYEDVLRIWSDKLPPNVSDQRLTHMANDLATVLHHYGDAAALPDDAVKGYAHLQAKLFKAGDDTISRARDVEKLFGDLDTLGKRDALKDSLIAYKQAVEVDPEAKFLIKNITSIQAQAYRYDSFTPQGGWANFSGSIPDRPEGWWCSFDFYDNKYIATDRLLLPLQTSAPVYRFEFATSEIVDKARIGRGFNEQAIFFEPLTRDIPIDFVGGGTSIQGLGSQFKADGVATLQRVIDMNTGQQVWPIP